MNKLAKIGIASSVLAATSLTAVTPAAARDHTGVAIAAGIIGLGLGAAIASDQPHYRQSQYYYDQTPRTYYHPPQNYGDGYGYGSGYGYGNAYAYGSGYGNGYASRERYWEQRRDEEARRRQWERQNDEDARRGYYDNDGY